MLGLFKDVLTVVFLVFLLMCVQFLGGVVLSGSLVLLEVLVGIMCREVRHTHEDQIQTSLQEFLSRYSPSPSPSPREPNTDQSPGVPLQVLAVHTCRCSGFRG